MQTTKQANGVVISLDAYRERRRTATVNKRDDSWQQVKATLALAGADQDEDRAEDARRLLLMPGLRRPDERELL